MRASRHNNKPFLIHSLRVAMRLKDIGEKTSIIVAAILHDVLEDTACTLDEVIEVFGSDVGELVELNSFDSHIEDYVAQYQEHFKRISKNRDALIIKTADILDNRRYLDLADVQTSKKVHAKHAYFVEVASKKITDHKLFQELIRDVRSYDDNYSAFCA